MPRVVTPEKETWWDLAPGGVFTRRTEITEKVRRDFGDLVCKCGNRPEGDGFYACLTYGTVVAPTSDRWDGRLYACGQCGRIIDQDTLAVVGSCDPYEVMDQAADLEGWDD